MSHRASEKKEKMEKITASEAVYGFAAWLTCRKDAVTLGANNDAAIVAELVGKWCKINELPRPRDGIYPDNIKMPKQQGEEQ